MMMGMAQVDTKKKAQLSTVKRLRELRLSKRLSANENVTYTMLWAKQSLVDSDNDRDIEIEAQAQNFSDGGVGLLTSEALKPLEIIQLNLSFSSFGITIPTIAEVVWAGRKSANGLYRVGLRYLL